MKSLSESGRAVISAPSLWRRLSVTSSVFLATVALAAQQWQWRSPLPQGNDLYALTYANGRFVAVGDYGTVLSAADGVDWVRHSLESNVTLNGIAYGNDTFVVVGSAYPAYPYFGPPPDFILTSTDGTNWTERPSSQTNGLQSVAFGNGVFVAVGGGWGWPFTNSILTSTDGVTWTPTHADTNSMLRRITFANGRFVAVGSGVVQISADGTNWGTFPVGGDLQDVTYGGGLWVAAGWMGTNSTPAPGIVSSADGTNWNVRYVGAAQANVYSELRAVVFANGRFLAMGRTITYPAAVEQNLRLSSADGLTWIEEPSLDTLLRPWAIHYGNGTFVAVGEFGNIATSPDGVGWIGRSTATPNNLRGVAYGNGTFVALGNSGTNLTSPDGIFWTGHITGTSANLREAVHALGQFVAVGSRGTILTSSNGVDWAAQSSGTTESLWDISYGNGTLVVVGGDSVGGDGEPYLHRFVILSSGDGTNWTTRLSNPDYGYFGFELHGIAHGNGLFVAVGRPGTILTSTNGIAWGTNRIPEYYPKGITFGNGTFVTVGETTNAWSSIDGSHWTFHPLPVPPFTELDDVTFGDGTFLAVGDGGIILTSTNGADWSREHSPTSTNLRDAAYGTGSFVIVGNNDHILQSGTNATTGPLHIVAQPKNAVVRPGATVTFNVIAQGAAPVTYQWQRHGTNLPGANGPALVLTNVQINDSAYFSVAVSDGERIEISETVFLLVTLTDPLDSWSVRASGPPYLYGITYAQDQFVAVGGSTVLVSPDGRAWTTNQTSVLNLAGVAFGQGMFVACGDGILTSPNGTNWTVRVPAGPLGLYFVAYGNGRFVAVANAVTNIWTSVDGTNWVGLRAPGTGSLLGVVCARGKFVAVGVGGRVLTSPDGLNWTEQNSGTNATLFQVAYGNGRFVAVGPPSVILTSPDARIWTVRTNPAPPSSSLYGVTFAHDRFVVVGLFDTILSSTDGVIWKPHLPVRTGRSVVGGPENFVAVGSAIQQSDILVPVPPSIRVQPQGHVTLVGTTYTLNVSAVGTPPPWYQWRHQGVDLPGATGTNYTIASVQVTNEGAYSVLVANPFGSVVSAPAEVVAGVVPYFLEQPLSQSMVAGGEVTLSAVVTGRPPPFQYIWRHERTLLRFTNVASTPVTFHTYTAPSAVSTQWFRVVVANPAYPTPGVISSNAFITVLADGDGDGLPDAWEDTFGFSATNAADGILDADGDGLSNRAEYIAGTDPTNTLSFLRVEIGGSTGATQLSFGAISNRTYTVQSADDLSTGPWLKLADIVARLTNRVEVIADTTAGSDQRFYRVQTPRQP